jgi:maleate isomerase
MSFGWRARIGYITPSVVEIGGYEFYQLAPEGVALVGVTCNITGWRRDQFDKAFEEVYDMAESLATRQVDYIIHGGVPLVASRGPGYDAELIQGIESRTSIPATTGVASGMAALSALGVERVAVVAPYPQEVMDSVEAFFEGSGRKVAATARMDVHFKELQWMEQRTMYDFVRKAIVDNPSVDGVYLPCPQWPIGSLVETLEQDFQRPMITSMAADLWRACSVLGVSGLSRRGGALMGVRPDAETLPGGVR